MRVFRRLLTAFGVLLVTTSAHADKPIFGDTFMLGIGGMDHKAKATFQSNRDGRPPFELDMNDLDMDDKTTTVWVGATWQFAESFGVSASYSNFDSKGIAAATEDGNFGDIEWMVDARLISEFDLDLYIVDLHWDFINTERSHFGVGVGLHIADISASINAMVTADINGNPITPIDIGSETAEVTAPLPNVLLRGGHRFGDNWYLGATGGYFSLKVGDIDGELVSLRTSLEWRPGGGNFGVGLGYQYVDVNVEDDSSNRVEKFDMEFYGPILHASLGF